MSVVSQILYYNQAQQYPQIQRDLKDVKKHVQKTESADATVEKAALESIPMVRRVASLPDKLKSGDGISALGLLTLAAINLPEDIDDIRTSATQINDFVHGRKFKGSYNYKDYQHSFSFFRGTLLHNYVDPAKSQNSKLANKLLEADKTLIKTGFGEKILDFLKVEATEVMETQRKDIGHSEESPRFVEAYKFEGQGKFKAFGELTARAMNRTTLLGVAALAVLELPKIIKSMGQGKDISEQAQNTSKQTLKSGINVASITAGIAYGGAIGSKYGKAFGSLVGMGIGAVLGSIASNKVQDAIG